MESWRHRVAGGPRPRWTMVPEPMTTAIERALGSPIATATDTHGGFTPGAAAKLQLADGRVVFAKALFDLTNPVSAEMYRREATVMARLPEPFPAPRLLHAVDQGTSMALVFEYVEGSTPQQPWREDELAKVLDAITSYAGIATPAPITAPKLIDDLDEETKGWRVLTATVTAEQRRKLQAFDEWTPANLDTLAELESRWRKAADGDSLLHGDLRADNILLAADRVVFVDWPSIAIGAAWFDLVAILPSVLLASDEDPERIIDEHPLTRDVAAEDISACLAALCGYFVTKSMEPPPPGLPTVRQFQADQARVGLPWLRRRLTRGELKGSGA